MYHNTIYHYIRYYSGSGDFCFEIKETQVETDSGGVSLGKVRTAQTGNRGRFVRTESLEGVGGNSS
jgi:hypothetical protein